MWSPSRTSRLYPHECSWYSFSLAVMVRSEGNMSLKNLVTALGIDPGTVRLVNLASKSFIARNRTSESRRSKLASIKHTYGGQSQFHVFQTNEKKTPPQNLLWNVRLYKLCMIYQSPWLNLNIHYTRYSGECEICFNTDNEYRF
jgi:hypothetical protein